jgi:hypothetical protein
MQPDLIFRVSVNDGDECRQHSALTRTGSSFTPETATNRRMFMLSVKNKRAKFWIDPVRLERSIGLTRTEVQRIQELVEKHREHLLRHWNEYFND